ncbi:sugar phosphate isomerase/epimerase family protein [Flexithrix dorotheae]|uniref:sugar phosphate isomerase/epimerase family protein n=1 Tax=Flexithrix dorotheae TaxID=70993 RepID=UPI00036A4463|nr:sugar phosphate isomerase/epimerase family protein [Flexithrix dorotheae]
MNAKSKLTRKSFMKVMGMSAVAPFLPNITIGRDLSEKQQHKIIPSKSSLKKSLKFGMVKEDLSVMDKFKLLKDLGFDGVELDSPNELKEKEILEARDKTGLEIPGVVNSVHWKSPMSDADPKVRTKCTESMKVALRDCKKYGGTTVLLVPAVVNEKTSYEEAYKRSQEEIRKILPVAEETGVKIAIENVWNNFLLSPMEAARYIDEFESDMIGWYLDIGNIVRYGWPEQWMRILGKRVLKLDIKEYSRKKANDEGVWEGFKVELLEGDCNWPEVMKAVKEVGYSGWGSAEIPGGDRNRLQKISELMDKIYKS